MILPNTSITHTNHNKFWNEARFSSNTPLSSNLLHTYLYKSNETHVFVLYIVQAYSKAPWSQNGILNSIAPTPLIMYEKNITVEGHTTFLVHLPYFYPTHKYCYVNIIDRSWRTWKMNQITPTHQSSGSFWSLSG